MKKNKTRKAKSLVNKPSKKDKISPEEIKNKIIRKFAELVSVEMHSVKKDYWLREARKRKFSLVKMLELYLILDFSMLKIKEHYEFAGDEE